MNFRQFFTTNTWWGKVLGAFFGYQIAGPVGALFGIIVGNFFDKGLSEHFQQPHLHYHQEKRNSVQKVFFEVTFLVMGHIAKADGRVSEQEIEMARILMSEMRLNQEQKNLAKYYFNEGKQASFNFAHTLNRLHDACHDNPDLLKLFIDIQYRIAMADKLTTSKIRALNTVFKQLGFSPLHRQYRFYTDFNNHDHASSHSKQQHGSSYKSNYQTSSNTLAQAYALLEITPNANKQETKKAYKRLISRNHPDKLIAQGLPEEMIKLANDKTQKITKAYELICSNKGW